MGRECGWSGGDLESVRKTFLAKRTARKSRQDGSRPIKLRLACGVDCEGVGGGGGVLDVIVSHGISYWHSSPTTMLVSLISILHALDAKFVVVKIILMAA
jgi:hypothetical protein